MFEGSMHSRNSRLGNEIIMLDVNVDISVRRSVVSRRDATIFLSSVLIVYDSELGITEDVSPGP